MANRTIYPYGAGGQTPSGIGIVDDLVTGGSNYALSAEMGKELNERILNNVSVERGTCVKFGTKVYTKLNSRQIELLNSTSVMSMTFMMNGGNGGYGSEDWRYIEIGAYSTDSNVLSFRTTYYGAFHKREFAVNTHSLTVISSLNSTNTPHPIVCTLVCDREHGIVKFYKGSTLVSTDTRNEYKVSKFVGDDGVIVFFGGDNNCRFYGLQLYDYDIMRGNYLDQQLNQLETSAVDVKLQSYNESHDYVDQTTFYRNNIDQTHTTNNGEITITRINGLAGSFYITNYGEKFGELVTEFTIDKSFNVQNENYSWCKGKLLYDSSGNLLYDDTINTTFPAGTYKMVTFWKDGAVGITTKEDGATLVLHSNRVRRVGCIAHFKFDTLINHKVYDDVSKQFYTFYSNTTCTTETNNYSINSLPLKTVYIGNLITPHYIGEIKITGGTVYIADDTWTWKRINNAT